MFYLVFITCYMNTHPSVCPLYIRSQKFVCAGLRCFPLIGFIVIALPLCTYRASSPPLLSSLPFCHDISRLLTTPLRHRDFLGSHRPASQRPHSRSCANAFNSPLGGARYRR